MVLAPLCPNTGLPLIHVVPTYNKSKAFVIAFPTLVLILDDKDDTDQAYDQE